MGFVYEIEAERAPGRATRKRRLRGNRTDSGTGSCSENDEASERAT